MALQLHRAAAAAREALIDLAAEESNQPREQFSIRDGQVVGSQKFHFGELTKGKKLMKVIDASLATMAFMSGGVVCESSADQLMPFDASFFSDAVS